nr:glycosyl hydrolase 108 family protein [uncultured Albidiferax sp.]
MNFDQAFDRLMGHEGGYVNDPRDPGGETNWGISKRSYPSVDIKALTRDGAKAIYRRDFWDVLGNAHPAITFQVFDFAVNSGIGTAIRKLQAAVGVADDGHWGPLSQRALGLMDVNDVLLRLLSQRLRFMAKLTSFDVYGRGWSTRIADNLAYAAEDN